MEYQISFPFRSFPDLGKALEFVLRFVEIPMNFFASSRSYQGAGMHPFDPAAAIDAMSLNGDTLFVLAGEGTDRLNTRNSVSFYTHPYPATECFWLSLETGNELRVRDLILAAGDKGMSFAYKYDALKAYWQSVDMVSDYEQAGKPYAHLKQYIDPIWSDEVGPMIDVSENPGHQLLTYHMKLMAGPEMWFGPDCWVWFDRERVASFPHAEEMRWTGKDILYIRLFDADEPNYEAGHILRLQETFRQWTRMNEVEGLLQQEEKRRGDQGL